MYHHTRSKIPYHSYFSSIVLVYSANVFFVYLLPITVLQLMFAMAGKFGCSAAWAMGITYSGELFPTTLRSAAVGVSSQVSFRLAGMALALPCHGRLY